MFSMKRSIAALIVCFKPHVLLTLCILLVIAHSIVITIQRGTGNSWSLGKQHDLTITMTTLVLVVALIWAAFFIFIVRFELRNELESLLVLFQCSKRGLRFMGVVGFHMALLTSVALLVSATVERSVPAERLEQLNDNATEYRLYRARQARVGLHSGSFGSTDDKADKLSLRQVPINSHSEMSKTKTDREYLLTIYKIWLTAIVYAFSYLVIENLVMFYADMSLVEFVHDSFLLMVAKMTGIDLSDYPAGEMQFNSLIRHRIR